MEDSAETSIAVYFGLQGIPNALEDPQNPKVRYSEPQLGFLYSGKDIVPHWPPFQRNIFLYFFYSLLMLIAHTSITRLQIVDSQVNVF